jgi:hypothetical protein
MQIREGFSIGDVIKQLRKLDQAAEDLGNTTEKAQYVNWVDMAERELRKYFPDPSAADGLITPRPTAIATVISR